MKTGALILASFDQSEQDRDSEDFAPFLPMVPLEGSTVIKKEINTFRKAGLSPIFVLGGHLSDVLKNHLSHKKVVFLQDLVYEKKDRGLSLEKALEEIWEYCDKVVSVPVECPMFSEATASLLMEKERNTRAVFQGKGELRLHVRGQEQQEEKVLLTEDEGLLYSLLEKGGREQIYQYAKKIQDENALSMHVKLVLRKEEDFFGPGILRLMKLIEETGSLQAAAAGMELSYSKAWKMVTKAEKQLGFPLVVRYNGGRNGGSSHLTTEGRAFMDRYQAMCQDMDRMAQSFFDVYFREFQ